MCHGSTLFTGRWPSSFSGICWWAWCCQCWPAPTRWMRFLRLLGDDAGLLHHLLEPAGLPLPPGIPASASSSSNTVPNHRQAVEMLGLIAVMVLAMIASPGWLVPLVAVPTGLLIAFSTLPQPARWTGWAMSVTRSTSCICPSASASSAAVALAAVLQLLPWVAGRDWRGRLACGPRGSCTSSSRSRRRNVFRHHAMPTVRRSRQRRYR